MPIQDGDVMIREKIAEGLEKLRIAYSRKGYVNFTCVPETLFDNETSTITLKMELDEAGRYTLGDVLVSGLPSNQVDSILQSIADRKSQPFSSEFVPNVFQQLRPILPACANPDQNSITHVDEKTHTVNLELHFENCYSRWLNSDNQTPAANCCPE
jgi:hypothetical protein